MACAVCNLWVAFIYFGGQLRATQGVENKDIKLEKGKKAGAVTGRDGAKFTGRVG